MSKMKSMDDGWGEADNAPTDEEVKASIPSSGGNNYLRLPEGVTAFEPKQFFKDKQAEGTAVCDMLVLPFGVDAHSLAMLPPAYAERDYLGNKHWRLDIFKTHRWVNTSDGIRTVVCPQPPGAQVKGVCLLCDKRTDMLEDTRDGNGRWDPKRLPKEIGDEKFQSCFLAYINGTDKLCYVEMRVPRPKNGDGRKDNAAADPKPTFFELLTAAQLDGAVTKSFWATGREPVWLRVRFRFNKFTAQDTGRDNFFWEPIAVTGKAASLSGVEAASVTWDRMGTRENPNPAYNVCHIVEVLPKEEIKKIADGIVPVKPRKDKPAETAADPCWDDVKDLDTPALLAYAKSNGLDLSHLGEDSPKSIVRKLITDHFGITRPAA